MKSPGTVIITDVTSINAKSSYCGAGIGAGYHLSTGTVTIVSASYISASGGTNGGEGGAGIGGGHSNSSAATVNLTSVLSINAIGGNNCAGIGGGGGGSTGTVTITSVSFISANGGGNGAGIGGGIANGIVTITSVTSISAVGGQNGSAGIGGGGNGSTGTITIISASFIGAVGGQYGGAGIGGGTDDSPGTVTIISVSYISATSSLGAGIGGGAEESTGTVTITSASSISAVSYEGAGIGGGISRSPATVTITSILSISATVVDYGAGIGGGNESSAEVYITSIISISAVGGQYGGAGIGGGFQLPPGTVTVTLTSVSYISATSECQGAGIGGGYDTQTGTAIIAIISVSSISATGGKNGGYYGAAAGIGGGYQSSAEVYITSVLSIRAVGGTSGGAGIGGGGEEGIYNLTGEIKLTSVSSISATGGSNCAGIGAGNNNSFKNNIVVTGGNTIPNSFSPNNTDLNIGIYGDVDVTAIGGEGAAGIGGSADEANSGKINIEIGDGSDNPKVTALNKALASDPADGRINNVGAIGNGITKTVSSICSTDIKINSGEIHAIDTASTAIYSTTHSICIGGNNNEITPSSLTINGGDIYMYGNACFYQNGFSKGSDGITLPSGVSLNIGGTPPAVKDFTGEAISYLPNFKTTIRNFKDYGLRVETGASIFIDPITNIFLDYEYEGDVIPPNPSGFTGSAIHTDLNGRELGEKFNVPYTYKSNLNDSIISLDKVEFQKYTLNYIATISFRHSVDYGISENNDVNSVSEWITPSANDYSVVFDLLDEDTTYYVFIRIIEDGYNKYFKGGKFIDNYEYESKKIKTLKQKKEFTINFFSNGGKGIMKSLKVLENAKLILPKNAFTRTGYTFKNWNTEENGVGGATYKDKYIFNKGPDKDLDLYAIWSKNSTGGSGSGGTGSEGSGSRGSGSGSGEAGGGNGNGSGNDLFTSKGGDNSGYATAVVGNNFVHKNLWFGMIILILSAVYLLVVLIRMMNPKNSYGLSSKVSEKKKILGRFFIFTMN